MTDKTKPPTREQLKNMTDRQKKNLAAKMTQNVQDAIEANPVSCLIYYTLKAADPHKTQWDLHQDVVSIMKKAFNPKGSE